MLNAHMNYVNTQMCRPTLRFYKFSSHLQKLDARRLYIYNMHKILNAITKILGAMDLTFWICVGLLMCVETSVTQQ